MMLRRLGLLELLVVACASVMGLHHDQASAEARQSPAAQEERLSDVLPAGLAEFLKAAGVDRPLSEVDPEELEKLLSSQLGIEALASTLALKNFYIVPGTATLREFVEATEGATLLIAGSKMQLASGREVDVGQELFIGDVIESGIVLNSGQTTVLIEFVSLVDGTAGEILLGPGEAAEAAALCGDSCSVTCGQGYYACCRISTGGEPPVSCAICRCKKNGTSDDECFGGGNGSTSCSISLPST